MTNPTTSTNEPQTAAYQAAVDNVWFEIEETARQIKSSFYTVAKFELMDERIDYVVDLEQRMEWALGRRNRGYQNLGYDLSI